MSGWGATVGRLGNNKHRLEQAPQNLAGAPGPIEAPTVAGVGARWAAFLPAAGAGEKKRSGLPEPPKLARFSKQNFNSEVSHYLLILLKNNGGRL